MPEIVERVNRYMTTRTGERIERALRRLLRRGAPQPACESLFYNDNAGALRVHHRRIHNARHYARRLELIATLARELMDVDAGRPVVSAVTRPAYEHVGVSAASLPHLLLHFCNNTACSRPFARTKASIGRTVAVIMMSIPAMINAIIATDLPARRPILFGRTLDNGHHSVLPSRKPPPLYRSTESFLTPLAVPRNPSIPGTDAEDLTNLCTYRTIRRDDVRLCRLDRNELERPGHTEPADVAPVAPITADAGGGA
jgi:hypothetical protein